MPKPIEIGQQFLDSVLALIPEDKREEARSAYSRSQNEFQTAMNDELAPLETQRQQVEAWHGQLRTWSSGREAELARREAAIAARERGGNPNPNPANPADPPRQGMQTPAQTFTLEEVNRIVDEKLSTGLDRFGKVLVPAVSESMSLQQRHNTLYGGTKPFVLEELFRHPRIVAGEQGFTLSHAFEDLNKDRIAEVTTQQRTDAENKIRADERQKVLAEVGSNKTMPFPTPGDDDSPFGLMQKQQQTGEEFGAAAATRLFNEMRASGGRLPA